MDPDKSQYEKLGAATSAQEASANIIFILGRMDAKLELLQRELTKLTAQAEKYHAQAQSVASPK